MWCLINKIWALQVVLAMLLEHQGLLAMSTALAVGAAIVWSIANSGFQWNEDQTSALSDRITSDKIADKTSEETSENTLEETSDKTFDKTFDKTSDKTFDKTSEKASKKTSEKTSEREGQGRRASEGGRGLLQDRSIANRHRGSGEHGVMYPQVQHPEWYGLAFGRAHTRPAHPLHPKGV
jgi:hypothetical protein